MSTDAPVGLIPAAGSANRLGRLPCSKEILPVAYPGMQGRSGRVLTPAELLIERLSESGVRRTYVIVRPGKWDIPTYLGGRLRHGSSLAYVTVAASPSVPYTLDAAYPFVEDHVIAFGFPDILFDPPDAFTRLFARREETGAEVVLGLFPAKRPEKADMVRVGETGQVNWIEIKPPKTDLELAWIIAVWGPSFTAFLHRWVAQSGGADSLSDVHLGHTLRAAIAAGVTTSTVAFEEPYIDIGTPEDLEEAVRWQRV